MSKPSLQLFHHSNKHYALGLIVDVLRGVEPFASMPFGNFSSNLLGQIQRKHYLIARQGNDIVGYAGWSMSDPDVADKWLYKNYQPSYEEGLNGTCLVGSTFYAKNAEVTRFMFGEIRKIHPKTTFYFKRDYSKGKQRLFKTFNIKSG